MANIALKVGIDVSKSKFDVCYRSGNGTVSKTYSSGARSVKEFVSSLPEGSHCVMEATGVYHTRLAYALHEAGIIVSVVNPLVIKNFSRMRMARTKTDRADAELIMEYAEREDPPAWEPAEAECIKAHNCLVTIDLYQRQITAMRNEVEALEQSAVCDGEGDCQARGGDARPGEGVRPQAGRGTPVDSWNRQEDGCNAHNGHQGDEGLQ